MVLNIQGRTPWVDSACADCPGFLLLGAAPAPVSAFVSEPQISPWASTLLHGLLNICLDVVPRSSPTTGAKTGRTAHVFTAQGGTRRNILSFKHLRNRCSVDVSVCLQFPMNSSKGKALGRPGIPLETRVLHIKSPKTDCSSGLPRN